MIRIENLVYRAGNTAIINSISTTFLPGRFTMILGPNGSGKSTLLRLFSGSITPHAGTVFYGNENLAGMRMSSLSRVRAVLSQESELSFPLTVDEVIMMGRYPHFKFQPSNHDHDIINQTIALLKLEAFRNRNYLTLSGGEKQRVHFARVLAQLRDAREDGTAYLFMDEPLAGLDINFQQELLNILAALQKKNLVMVAVMHDINLAMQYADELLILKDGKVAAAGRPAEIMSPGLVKEVFNADTVFTAHPVTGLPVMLYNK